MAPAETALLGALVAHSTKQEMRRVSSYALLALANSTLPPQQGPDAGLILSFSKHMGQQ
jgi:hypothetical protein